MDAGTGEAEAGFDPYADLDDDNPYGVVGPQPVPESLGPKAGAPARCAAR